MRHSLETADNWNYFSFYWNIKPLLYLTVCWGWGQAQLQQEEEEEVRLEAGPGWRPGRVGPSPRASRNKR